MIRILIEVGDVHGRFGVAVEAKNIREALRSVEALHPDGEPRVVFPIEPEAFFVSEPVVQEIATNTVMAQARVAS